MPRAERRPRRAPQSLALLGALAVAACDVATVKKLDPVTGKAIIEEERRAMFARYVPSKRHMMQVDFDDYLHDLAREMRRGEKRALRTRKDSRRA